MSENQTIHLTDAAIALVGLAAAAASSNPEAFEGYHSRAAELGVSKEEMIKAVNVALRIKMGPHQEIMDMAQGFLVGGGGCCGGTNCSDGGCGDGEGSCGEGGCGCNE